MKICFFSDLFYPCLLGGGENRYFEIAKRLVSHGDEVRAITTSLIGRPSYEVLENGKLEIFRFGFPKHPIDKRSVTSVPGYILASVFNSRVVDDCDLLDLNTYASALAGKVVAVLGNKPCVITIHDVFSLNGSTGNDFFHGFLGDFVKKVITRLHRHGHFITVSEAMKSKMIRLLRISPERIHVVPNGIDFNYINKIASKSGKRAKDLPKKLIFVGRLVNYKNVDHLIHATKQLLNRGLNVVLDIVGTGSEEDSLRKLAMKLDISKRVTFHGFIQDRQEVIKLVTQADALVSPSVFEGFGIVLLEAMAAQTPVVAYNLPSYSGFALNRHNSILVEKNNVQKLIDATRSILTNKKRAFTLAQNGYETARSYDWNNIIHKLRNVYKTILNQS